MDFNAQDLEHLGYSRPRAANQTNGGRATGVWDTALLGDLEKALKNEGLLNRISDSVRPGHRVMIAAFDDIIGFRNEQLAGVAEVIVIDVTPPQHGKPDSGRVVFAKLSHFDLKAARKLVEAQRLQAGAA